MKSVKIGAALVAGLASVAMLAAVAGTAVAAPNTPLSPAPNPSDTVDGAAFNPVLPAVAKVVTTNAGTTLPARQYNMLVTLKGQNIGGKLVDAPTSGNGSQQVPVFVTTAATTAVATACEQASGSPDANNHLIFTEALTPAGCDMSSVMPGVQVGAEASIFAKANLAGGIADGIGAQQTTVPATSFGWTAPGQYVYTISETSTIDPVAANGDCSPEQVLFDDETYTMTINVAADDQGNLYIKDAGTTLGTPQTPGVGGPAIPGHPGSDVSPGTPGVPGTPSTDKVDGTPQTPGIPGAPGTPATPGTPAIPGTPGDGGTDGIPLSDIAFSNEDTFTAGCPTKPTTDDGGINVQKKVTGDGSKTNLFDIKVVPSDAAEVGTSVTANGYLAVVINSDGSYLANPVDPSGTAIKLADSSLQTVSDAGVIVVPATGIDIGLKNGQSLHFINALYGTGWTGTDTVTGTSYTPAEDDTLAGVAQSHVAGIVGTDLTTPKLISAFSGDSTKTANGTLFTNDLTNPSITGIVIDNLPYILLLVLALGGAVTYVIVKSRGQQFHTVSLGK